MIGFIHLYIYILLFSLFKSGMILIQFSLYFPLQRMLSPIFSFLLVVGAVHSSLVQITRA